MIEHVALACTTDAVGAGTAISTRPINGRVLELRNDSAGWGGTADYTFLRDASTGGGTVATLTNQAGPFSTFVGGSVSGGGPSASSEGIPVAGNLTLIVAQAAVSTAGTVHVIYEV
jgi:hypothetical protein